MKQGNYQIGTFAATLLATLYIRTRLVYLTISTCSNHPIMTHLDIRIPLSFPEQCLGQLSIQRSRPCPSLGLSWCAHLCRGIWNVRNILINGCSANRYLCSHRLECWHCHVHDVDCGCIAVYVHQFHCVGWKRT